MIPASPSSPLALGTLRGTLRAISLDLDRVVVPPGGDATKPVGRLRRLGHMILPTMLCAALYRLAHLLHRKRWRRLAALVAFVNRRLTRAVIHPASVIGPGLVVPHTVGVLFCGTAGAGLTLFPLAHVVANAAGDFSADLPHDAPTLGDHVTIGAHAVVVGPCKVGSHAFVGVNVVVMRDIPDHKVLVERRTWKVVSRPSGGAS